MNENMNGSGATVATKSHTWVAVVVVVLVGVLAAGAGAWGFLRYSRSAEARILESFERMGKAKSVAYEGSVVVKGDLTAVEDSFANTEGLMVDIDDALKSLEVTVGFKGKYEEKVKDAPNSETNVSIKAKTSEKEYPAFAFDFSSVDKVSYVRVPSIPPMLGFDLSVLNNEWISFDLKEVEEQVKSLTIMPETTTEEVTRKKEADKIIESLKRTAALKPPVKVTKRLRTEVVNGVRTQPYVFVLNKKNAAMILDKLAQNEKQTGVTKADVTEMKEMLNEIEKFEGKIWVGTKDVLPYKMVLVARMKDATTKQPVDMTITYSAKDFNKPMNIAAPTNSMNVEDAFKVVSEKFKEQQNIMYPPLLDGSATGTTDVFGLPTGSTSFDTFPSTDTVSGRRVVAPASDSNASGDVMDGDMDGLSDTEEALYGTDPTKADTDGDGYDDKMEIENGYNPLR